MTQPARQTPADAQAAASQAANPQPTQADAHPTQADAQPTQADAQLSDPRPRSMLARFRLFLYRTTLGRTRNDKNEV